MKKLLLVAALGVAGLVSANSFTSKIVKTNSTTQVKFVGGWCEISIYNSSGALVGYSYTYENSYWDCYSRAVLMAL